MTDSVRTAWPECGKEAAAQVDLQCSTCGEVKLCQSHIPCSFICLGEETVRAQCVPSVRTEGEEESAQRVWHYVSSTSGCFQCV